jgi:predicted enzyme involved in methoxymalonyl-ACP biosynthesis
MILSPVPDQTDVLEIDTWVMSCRVFGRQLEIEAMNIAVESVRNRGIRALRADYVPTKKNGVISELYESLGFSRLHQSAQTETSGTSRWILKLAEYTPQQTQITRRKQ